MYPTPTLHLTHFCPFSDITNTRFGMTPAANTPLLLIPLFFLLLFFRPQKNQFFFPSPLGDMLFASHIKAYKILASKREAERVLG